MTSKLRLPLLGAALCALIHANASSLHASTIIKLNLANVGPDLSMVGGVLGTVIDSDGATTGHQNTDVEYTGFLEPIPDINTANASFTLSNLNVSGSPTVFGTLVTQNYSGGTFSLYDQFNVLLLSGLLDASSLVGTDGAPATGALFSTTFASVTGGVLSGFIETSGLGLSMNLTNVNGGLGLSVVAETLQPFTADALVTISGDPTPLGGNFPEPGTFVLATMAVFAASAVRRRPR